jgi:hypothetical protein
MFWKEPPDSDWARPNAWILPHPHFVPGEADDGGWEPLPVPAPRHA